MKKTSQTSLLWIAFVGGLALATIGLSALSANAAPETLDFSSEASPPPPAAPVSNAARSSTTTSASSAAASSALRGGGGSSAGASAGASAASSNTDFTSPSSQPPQSQLPPTPAEAAAASAYSNGNSYNYSNQAAPAAVVANQQETIIRQEADFIPPASGRRSPWALLGGVNAGYANLSVEPMTGEVDKDGFRLDLKGLVSYYFEAPWVLDMGIGWAYTSVSGENMIVREKNILRSAFLELSPRYRIGSSWQFGPVLDLGFGADLSLGQPFTDRKQVGFYPGIELLYETSNPSQITRVGGRISTDLSIPNRSLIVAQLTLHFGGPLGGKTESEKIDTVTRVATTQTFVEPMPMEAAATISELPIPEEEVVVRVIDKNQVSVELSKEVTNFATGSARLSPRSQEFLRRLGAYLNDNKTHWTKADVGGHTDIRGRLAYNMMLSKRRASSVGAAMIEGGAPAKRITMAGYGPKIPIDARYNEGAWAKNRRVEIRITGSNNSQALADGISLIKVNTIRDIQAEVIPPARRRVVKKKTTYRKQVKQVKKVVQPRSSLRQIKQERRIKQVKKTKATKKQRAARR